MDSNILRKKVILINKEWMDKILYFITGLLAFSGLSFYLTKIKLGLPFALPELLLIPFLLIKHKVVYLYIKQLLKGLLVNAKLIPWLVCWIFLVLLGYILTGDILAVLAIGRNILYIIILAFLFSRTKDVSYDFLFYVSFGAIVGELLHSLFYPVLYQIYDPLQIVCTNTIAIFLTISIPIIYRKTLLQIITTSIAGLLIFISGYRILLLMGVISFVSSYCLVFIHFKNKKYLILNMIRFILIISLSYFFFIHYVNYYGDSSYKYHRIVTRTIGFLKKDFNTTQDDVRFTIIESSLTGIGGEKVLPHGFISKAKGLFGLHIDVPIVFLYDTIGSIFSVVLLLWILLKGGRFAIHEMKKPIFNVDTSIALFFIAFILLLFINGRFLLVTYESWLFGIILGRYLKIKRT